MASHTKVKKCLIRKRDFLDFDEKESKKKKKEHRVLFLFSPFRKKKNKNRLKHLFQLRQ